LLKRQGAVFGPGTLLVSVVNILRVYMILQCNSKRNLHFYLGNKSNTQVMSRKMQADLDRTNG
jgi:hypothetical protein